MVDVANIHLPVLLDDCVNLMAPALEHENAVAVDCTLGLAGHSIAFLKTAPQARLIGIDRDSEALGLAAERMEREGLADRFIPVHAAFDQLDQVLTDRGIERVDAVFMDLGLSSLQIDETDRGFSYSHDAPLDMRLVDEVVPQAHRPAGNPAKRVFQALRIEVNGELDKLASTLPQAANRLHVGGRLVVESYHSLEDKTVKSFMAQGLRVDVPAGLPVIPPDAQPFFTDLTRGAIKADEHEIAANPRSASVRLRAVTMEETLYANRAGPE